MKQFDFYNRKLKSTSRVLRNEMTRAEKKIWYEFLCELEPKCKRQRPIGNYIVVFYISKVKIIIEIDGDSHFLNEEARKKDVIRDTYLKSLGLHIMRFSNNEVYDSFDSVCERIKVKIQETLPLHPNRGGIPFAL
jgi:very-short-patch-repair endonuclease